MVACSSFAHGALAADLPLAEPVDHVKVCETYGIRFFALPGTNTCLKISGIVRSDRRWEQDNSTAGEAASNVYTDTRARMQIDARSETDYGTLRSFMEIEGRADSTAGNGSAPDYPNGALSTGYRAAFVQFAGFTAGKVSQSLFDYVPYRTMSDLFSTEQVNTLAYTASVAGGYEFTVGVEDKYFRASPGTFSDGSGRGLDQTWPSLFATVSAKGAWGDAKVSAVVQDNEGDVGVGPGGDELGWAALAGVSLNLPSKIKGSAVWFEAGYSEGAGSYVGAEAFSGTFRNFTLGNLSDQSFVDGRFENASVLSLGTGIGWYWTGKLNSNLALFYTDVDRPDGAAGRAGEDFRYFFAEANTYFNIVPNADLIVAAQYGHLDLDSPLAPNMGKDDHLAVVTRLARTF
ncbi:porin [Terrihabitans sp. B22-R8]|uniref:porin n=1 Tax=Terrihabitans sp. B22-R8 TaxID=3425128 RepID=UPI00403D5156